ncbi:M48 family metallopeptidase [Candidatus Latescibacterota bacterium]
MNLYAIIILSALLADFVLDIISNILNLNKLSGELPQEFAGFYNTSDYDKSQDYTRATTKFGLFTSTFNLFLVLIFWFADGFNSLDSIIRGWQFHPILSGLAYIGILLGLKMLFSLPFSIYSTFVIEERYGFNKTTWTTFITDIFKGLALTIMLGGPLLAGMFAFFQYTGEYAWVYCWLAATVYTLIIQFIAPAWILPIFNKFTPLEDGDLKTRIMEYARSVRFSLADVFVIDGSRRSSKSNAYFTGFGKNKRIALFDTLVEKHTIPELVAVLAHEIGHYKKKHIRQGIVISILHTGVMFFLLSVFLSHEGLFEAFYMENISIYAGFIFFGMLYTPIELVLSIFMNMLSRHNEYQADSFASDTFGEPEAMVNALKKLSVHNLSNLRPHSFYVFLNYSHPPVLRRIEAIRNLCFDRKLTEN